MEKTTTFERIHHMMVFQNLEKNQLLQLVFSLVLEFVKKCQFLFIFYEIIIFRHVTNQIQNGLN